MNNDVEDLLREGMARFTADLRAPGGMVRRAARRRRRRLALRSAAGAAALTAAVVALAAGVVPGAGHGGAGLAAYVVKRVDGALTAAEPGQIAQMTVTTTVTVPDGTTATATAREWSYNGQWRSVTYSPAGHLVYDEGISTASVYTLVNYPERTWARQAGLGLRPALKPGPGGCGPVIAALPLLFQPGLPGAGLSAGSPATVAKALRAAISCGTLAVAPGRQRVDGVEAIELTSRPGSQIAETIWVSPGSYLPVRVVLRSPPGPPVFQREADITWLPPTAQNLAKLTVPIPAGFRQVSLADAVMPILKQTPGGLLPAPQAPCLWSAGQLCTGGTSAFGSGPENAGYFPNAVFAPGL
ncbi:MAG TPA: hypothetical protein VGY96_14895 [Streptosporangiaceae bacterium]|jgi:hypothetical protein|nr:hypothetical protein [Streptosporangiaceae bacterium]